MATEILAPTTDADTSREFIVGFRERPGVTNPTTVFVPGLAGSEEATLEFSVDDGESWVEVLSDGISTFSVAVNTVVVTVPGRFRVNKDATAGAVGVYIVAAGAERE